MFVFEIFPNDLYFRNLFINIRFIPLLYYIFLQISNGNGTLHIKTISLYVKLYKIVIPNYLLKNFFKMIFIFARYALTFALYRYSIVIQCFSTNFKYNIMQQKIMILNYLFENLSRTVFIIYQMIRFHISLLHFYRRKL